MMLEGRTTVVSLPFYRFAVLATLGASAALITVVFILFLVIPDLMGPSPVHPDASSFAEVVALFAGVWLAAVTAWVVLDREVALRGPQILLTRGTGAKVLLARSDIKWVHSFPFRGEFVVWISYKRGAAAARSIFFSRSRDLPA